MKPLCRICWEAVHTYFESDRKVVNETCPISAHVKTSLSYECSSIFHATRVRPVTQLQ